MSSLQYSDMLDVEDILSNALIAIMKQPSSICKKVTKYAITGATGLLGRNILFEIIKKNQDSIENIQICILGRFNDQDKLKSRIENILKAEVFDYLNNKSLDQNNFLQLLKKRMIYVDICLTKDKLGIRTKDLKSSEKLHNIDLFFHVAALTDFRDGDSVSKKLEKVNVFGTCQVLNLVLDFKVKELAYISSAYVCGLTSGDISPDYINIDQKFRNPYENSKLKAEKQVRDFCKYHNISYKIFRPSTICGRLIEKEEGSINKFDVFYGWAAFFLRQKKKVLGLDYLNKDFKMDLRFCASQDSGLNIVPVDFAAKIIYSVCHSDSSDVAYHIVNEEETPHRFYFFEMLEAINITGVKMVGCLPEKQNRLEEFYSKTVGKIFTPYITSKETNFNTQNLDKIYNQEGLSCPKINKDSFAILMNYAKKHNFGI